MQIKPINISIEGPYKSKKIRKNGWDFKFIIVVCVVTLIISTLIQN